MRQTKLGNITFCLKVIFCALLLICGNASTLLADLTGLAITVDTVPDGATSLNANGSIKLQATWSPDSGPYSVEFKNAEGFTLGGTTTDDTSYITSSRVSNFTDGSTISVTATVKDLTTGSSDERTINTGCRVDTSRPTISVTTDQTTYPANGTVIVNVTSNEALAVPTVTCDTGSVSNNGAADGSLSYTFTITLSNATAGNHQINVSAHDISLPSSEPHPNSSTGQCFFNVGTSASGDTTINEITPGSPTNIRTVTINGTCPDLTSYVKITVNGADGVTIPVTGTSWTGGVNLEENRVNQIVATSYDTNGTLISNSTAISHTVDTTAPNVPTFRDPLPTNTNQGVITASLLLDESTTELAPPVKIIPYLDGTAQASVAVNSGAALVNLDLGSVGQHQVAFSAIDSAGNESARTTVVNITYESGVEVGATISMTSPLTEYFPLPSAYKLGAGSYTIRTVFDREMNVNSRPTLALTTKDGAILTSNEGSWSNNRTFEHSITVPSTTTSQYDGLVQKLTISGATDIYGNTVAEVSADSPFTIDCTRPTSQFNSMDTIYVKNGDTQITISGSASDIGDADSVSGIGALYLVYRKVGDTEDKLQQIPVTGDGNWNFTWDVSALTEGTYGISTIAFDQARPASNSEDVALKTEREVVVDLTAPSIVNLDYNYNTTGTLNIGEENTVTTEQVTRVTASFQEADSSGVIGSGIDIEKSTITVVRASDNATISGEKTLTSNRMVLSFSPLVDGKYNIEFKPVDIAGNVGEVASCSLIVSTGVTTANATYTPNVGVVANLTNEALALSQVWAELSGSNISYTKSKISVQYGGNEIGAQIASETGLVYQLFNTSGGLKSDQSHDGRYNVTVTPISDNGIAGVSETSYFIIDTQAPVITSTSPSITFGSNPTATINNSQATVPNAFKVQLSDSPRDIVQFSSSMDAQEPAVSTPAKASGDSSWYEGSGSGLNATFTITVGSAVASTTYISSDGTMALSLPDIGEVDTTSGLLEIQVKVEMEDGANDGETIPNKRVASYTYYYDCLAPEAPTFNAPKERGKYCKDSISLSATAEDKGTGIAAFFYCVDSGEWVEVPVSNSSGTAQLSTTIITRDLSEGEHTIKIKVVDNAGNESQESSRVFIKDTTPPEAAGGTYPFANAVFNSRVVSFRWNTVTDAKYYLLQVSDNAGFGTIVNADTASVLDTGLSGQMTTTNTITTAIPKDGTFYWRMASVEKVEDGYNVSNYSTSLIFTVDTVKPRILSISPTPSSSNVITNGQVTFTVIFSEPMNGSVDITAQLTTAGGQVMKIERESYDTNTWTGTTVIPKGNSALYDGNAVITIADAVDLAGNKMSEDTSHTVIVNTGPAFDTKLFSNPANAYEIMILTKSSEALNAPPTCSVEQNGISTPVAMNFLRQRYYAGSYKIDSSNPGKAYIYLSGTDLNGQVGQGYVQFVVADLSASKRAEIAGVKASIKAAAGSAYKASSIYMLDRDTLESPFTNDSTTSSLRASIGIKNSNKASVVNTKELTPILALEEIGPSSVNLKKCLLYEGSTDYITFTAPEDKIHLYRMDKNGNWQFQGGSIKDYTVKAQITGLGRLALMADTKEPTAQSFSPQELDEVDAAKVEFKGEFTDGGSGLVNNSFKLELDGRELTGVEIDDEGKFSYKMKYALQKGKHEVSYTIQDKAGNILKQSSAFRAEIFALNEFTPYPSPAKNYIQFQYKFGLRPDSIKMKIYDSAGHLVKDISDLFAGNSGNSRSARYDLTNRKGKRIANGVYFYKLTATRNGQTFKKTGKFAVLR